MGGEREQAISGFNGKLFWGNQVEITWRVSVIGAHCTSAPGNGNNCSKSGVTVLLGKVHLFGILFFEE